MKQKTATHIKILRITFLLFSTILLIVQIATSQAEAAPVISEEQAIAIATGQDIGANNFRISYMGLDDRFDASRPAVAYNSTDNEYLVVWYGDNNLFIPGSPQLVDEEYEIYGQRVDAATGEEVGPNDFRISDMGPDGDSDYEAYHPAVAYDSVLNQYLVVWEGDENEGPLVDEDFEIFGQLLRSDGVEIGTNDFRISRTGKQDGDINFPAANPAVTYNPKTREYLVVWEGIFKSTSGPISANKIGIFGQRLNANTGETVAINDIHIGDSGPVGNGNYNVFAPAVTYNSVDNQYLVVWHGDDDTKPLVDNGSEIFGQLLQADGAKTGLTGFRISDMGPDGNANFDAYRPAVAHDPILNQYLVVWAGDDNTAALVNNEYEIFGQLLHANGTEISPNDFRISNIGPDGDTSFAASTPDVVYNAAEQEYLVVWVGKDQFTTNGELEFEVFGQRINASNGDELGNDFRISDLGPDGEFDYRAVYPFVAYNSTQNQYLVVWYGDDDDVSLGDEEFEIFGQLIQADGKETGQNDHRLSDMGRDDRYDTHDPVVAYNTKDNEYLVVWSGTDNRDGLSISEYEIFGCRLDADTGEQLGDMFVISDPELDRESNFDAYNPAIAYNPTLNQYLVVWEGDTEVGSPPKYEYEIFGQLLLADGTKTGENDFRISRTGPEGDGYSFATTPAVTYNTISKQYLVVWEGAIKVSESIQFESEIYGRRVNAATGQPIEANDLLISQMGPDGDAKYGAYYPNIAYNSQLNQYLVVWYGDDDTAPLVDNEYEIFGQLLKSDGSATGTNDFRISDMGPNGDANFQAGFPAVVYNSDSNQFLVVWNSSDDTTPLVVDENEIFGQLLLADGSATGENDFRISDMGPNGDTSFGSAYKTNVAYNAVAGEYLVVWFGDDDTASLVNGEYEIFGQRLHADGTEIGANDFRISKMGPDGNVSYKALAPVVACQVVTTNCLVVWTGDDNTSPLEDNEFEIFGQFAVLEDYAIYLPFVVKP